GQSREWRTRNHQLRSGRLSDRNRESHGRLVTGPEGEGHRGSDSISYSGRRWLDSASAERASNFHVRSGAGGSADYSRTRTTCDDVCRKGAGLGRSRPGLGSEKTAGKRLRNLPPESRSWLRKRSFAGVGEAGREDGPRHAGDRSL